MPFGRKKKIELDTEVKGKKAGEKDVEVGEGRGEEMGQVLEVHGTRMTRVRMMVGGNDGDEAGLRGPECAGASVRLV